MLASFFPAHLAFYLLTYFIYYFLFIHVFRFYLFGFVARINQSRSIPDVQKTLQLSFRIEFHLSGKMGYLTLKVVRLTPFMI